MKGSDVRIQREKLLQELESVQAGLSPREIVEQSSCFVFNNGKLITFNDEVSCQRPTELKMTGAVAAAPLLAILQKLTIDEIDVEPRKESLLIKAKNKRASIRMEQEILLPIDALEKPKKWLPMHEDFAEAVDMASQCTSEDASTFNICCVHITPKFLEGSDNFQITRYKLKTGVEGDVLIKQSSIKTIVSLGMMEFCETDSWMHFRNKQSGLIYSCRRYLEEYPDFSEFFAFDGSPLALPKGIGEACEKAEIFSSENKDRNEVKVEIRKGAMRMKGQGPLGWYQEVKKLAKYNGEQIEFFIAPKLLVQITNRANECIVSSDRLKIDGGKFCYVVSLGTNDSEGEPEDGSQEDNEE